MSNFGFTSDPDDPDPAQIAEPPNDELDDDLDDDEGSGVVTDVVGRYVFSRNVRLTRHPERNTFGLQLQSPGEALRSNSIGCLVKAVLPSCTAPDGSVQAGDRILSVNGTTTLEWSYHQIVTFIRETNPEVLVLSLRRELPEAEVAATAAAAKAAPKPKAGTRATEGAGGTDAKDPGQSSAKGNDETKKKGASKLPDNEADGKSLTSTKTAPDVQANVAGLATTKAPPPATADGSNEAAAAPVQKTAAMLALPESTQKPLSTPAERAKRFAAYEEANAKTKPAPEFGEGWRVLEVTRKGGKKAGKHTDCYWFSPKERFRLRSKAEVRRFQLALEATAPREDEELAWAVMKGHRAAPGGAAAADAAPPSSSSSNIGTAEYEPAKPDSSNRQPPSSVGATTASAAATFHSGAPAGSNSEADANASSTLPPPNNTTNPGPRSTAAAAHPPDVGATTSGTIAVSTDPKMPSGGKEKGGGDGVGDVKKSNGSMLDKANEPKPKKKRGRPPKKKKEADDSVTATAEKEGPKTKKRRRKMKGAGDASTASSAGIDPAIFDIAGGFSAGDATPDLTFTSEKGEGETDVDRLVKATIGAQASNLSEPDRPEVGSSPQIKFVYISAPIREGRVAAEIVLNDVKIGSIFAEFVCKSANFVEKCEQTGMEFPDLELVAGELFREAGQLQCEELQDYQNEWEPKNRPQEEAYYLQIKHIFIQETEFDTEEEGSDLVAHVLHRFLRDPRIKRWKIAGYKTVHYVGEFYVSNDEIWNHSSNPEEVIEKKWVEWEAQKNTQIGADARPFVRVGFQEIGAESSEHKGILFLTKNMFLPETEILSHAQAVERKLRSDAPVDVEEYRKLKLKTEFLRVILKEETDDELDSRRFNSQTSLHRAPETYDADGELVEKLMPQIEEFITKGADIKESHILHAAAHRHYLGLFKPLIEKGADVNALDDNSMTPLMIVAANIGKRIEISADRSLRIIWDLRSLCNADRNLQDRAGRTALGHYYRAWRDMRGFDREVGAPIKDTPINKSIEDMLRPDDGPTEADKRAKDGD